MDTKPNTGDGGLTGTLKVSPALLDFGKVDVGATSTPQSVTVTVSTAAVAISPAVTGPGFVLAGTTCASSQAPGTCTISVTFAPTTIGGASGALVVGSASVNLSGTGNQPGIFTAPDRIDLGTLKPGATAAVTVQIAPQGTLPGLTCTSSNPTELAPNAATTTCPATGAVSAACVYGFTFTASLAGARTDTVTCIGGTAPNTKTTSTIVAATVVGPSSIAVSQNTAQFSAVAGKTDAVVITVSNNGQSPTAAAPLATIALGSPDFTISANDCVVALAPLSTCKVTVTYAPTAAGTKTGSLSVADGATVLSVALNGSAITDRSVSISPSSPDFGSVTVGESKATTFTMKNTGGTATGVITLSGSSDEFKIGSDQCSGATLAATTGTCTFVVTFSPAGAAGARSTIINASDAAGPLATAKLAGTAAAQPKVILSITPPTLDFGTTNVGLQAGPKVFTITNTGDTASAALAVVKTDVSGAAQFTYTTTCTSTLDPQTNCQVVVTFAPTIAGNASATIAVTDGAVTSKSGTVVGTALEKGSFLVKCNDATSSYAFGSVVVNQTDTVDCTVTSPTAATQATGALTIAATGDFAIPAATNLCTASLIAGDTVGCKFKVAFTPTVAGARTGALTVTGANGGVVNGALSGTGLALVQLVALGATAGTAGTSAVTGLDFGMTPNASSGNVFAYRLVVRGGTAATATTTTPTLTLAAGTPADYKFVSPSAGTSTPTWSATATPCGSAVSLPPAHSNSLTPGYPGVAANARVPASFTVTAGDTADAQGTGNYYVCDFYVQFAPVSGKNLTTPKAATVTATATAGGTASLALTGIASGPLTIAPTAVVFAGTTLVGSSTAQTLTVTNSTTGNVDQGVLSVAVGGTNAADFQLTSGSCLVGQTLTPGETCTIVVTFAPSIGGAEGATVTVTASTGGETVTATLAGTGASASALTVSPTAVSPASVSFGSVAQNDNGDWKTFTITNPATSTAPVGPITFDTTTITSGAEFQLYEIGVPGVTGYPNGSCGSGGSDSTTSLSPGASCTLQVRLIPGVNLGAINGTLTVNSSISIPLSGTGTPQLVLSGSAITLVNNVQTVAFGNVVKGSTGTQAFTVTNNGAASAALSTNLPGAAFDTVSTAGGCGSTLAAKQSCTMTVTFSPGASAATGAASKQLTVTGSTSTVTVSANLTATVVDPASIDLYAFSAYDSTNGIHLGAAPMDTSTGVLTLVFTNKGGSPTSNMQASLSGTDFTIPTENKGTCANLGGVLNPGATCTVNVQVTPTGSVGPRTGQLVVSATAVGGKTIKLDASGLTTSNSVWVTALSGSSSSMFTFSGSTPPAGATQYFVLHNASTADVALGSSTTLGGDVSVGGPSASQFVASKPAAANVPSGAPAPCGTTLTPGNACTFAVTFTPALGTATDLYRNASLINGSTPVLGLMGRAQLPATLALSAVTTGNVTVTGSAVDFGQILSGQTPSLTFTITNTGEVATAAAVGLLLQSASTSTANYATLGTSTCGSAALAANGGTCTVVVNSQLPGSTGAKAGLSVTATGAPVSTSPFTLAADVVAAASLSAPAPSTTSFGSIAVGAATPPTITITVTNGNGGTYDHTQQDTGALSVTLSDATNFAVASSSTCLNNTTGAYYSLPLSGGAEQCTIVVKFVPTSAGAKSTQVAISATPGGSPQAFTLTGTGLTTLSFQNAAQTASASLAVATFKVDSTAATGLLKNSLSGSTAFTISRTTCFGATLSAGTDQCEVDVTFTGTPTATAQTVTLTVTDGTANATATGTFTVTAS